MNLDEFSTRFSRELQERGVVDADRSLREAQRLFSNHVPVLFSVEQLCLVFGLPEENLREFLKSPGRSYRSFELPKRTGGYRRISQPQPGLAQLQLWVLRNILNNCAVHHKAMAFKKGVSIRTNASIHAKQRWILSLDLIDFFGSVSQQRVTAVFQDLGYRTDLARALSQICCLNGRLPQGAPTSPALSNLVFFSFDVELDKIAMQSGFRYSRYADDLCISGDTSPIRLLSKVRKILDIGGFRISPDKTRLMSRHRQQRVTGLVVNEDVRVPRSTRRQLRQELYYIRKFGTEGHQEYLGSPRNNRAEHLRGIAEFIRSITPNDPVVRLSESTLGRLRSRSSR